MDLETVARYVLFAGVALVPIAWLWLVIAAFRTGFWWGVLSLIPPLFLVFVVFRWHRAWMPACGLLLGLVLVCAAVGMVHYSWSQLTERDKIVREDVDGKQVEGRHLTVTGWNKRDDGLLLAKPDTVVLQMANPDVTDDTLYYVLPMRGLYELDLDNTQITDRGLALLKDLPNLQRLRLGNTRITDEGFKEFLANKESLKLLNLRETDVSPETVKEWKRAKEGRRALR